MDGLRRRNSGGRSGPSPGADVAPGIASDAPLGYALSAYAKSAKTDLSRADRRSIAMIVEATESAAKETQ